MLTDAPAPNEFEISIFGPGKGESILVHLGKNEWIIVDSCVDQVDNSIPALKYLETIGVDPAGAVKVVLGSHAHDDHIAGISRIFAACESATFVCSSALTREEFFAVLEIDSLQVSLRSRIRREYQGVFATVKERGRRQDGLKPLRTANEGRVLFERQGSRSHVRALVKCLSPSDEAFFRAVQALAAAYPVSGQLRGTPPADPNELAIALWVECGDTTVLLGSDLTIGPAGCGWQAVLATFAPNSKASLFKIPHHGSPNAHHPSVWGSLVDSPVAILAPYRAGRRPLPAESDIERIKAVSSELHSAASPKMPVQSRRVRRAAAALGPLATNVVEPWGRPGQVRARYSSEALAWRTEHVPPARQL
jgi:hypothetical protein